MLAFSVITHEKANIARKEQLSIGMRFFDEEKIVLREEFLVFVELESMDAETIVCSIEQFLVNKDLDT